jgi:diguanylate cyclase (GGDEF)-like protein
MVARYMFDVVLYDATGADGEQRFELLTNLRQAGYRGAIIVIGQSGDKQTAAAALSAGAHEYLPKDAHVWNSLPSLLVRALRFGRLARRVAELEGAVESLRSRVEQEGRLDELTGAYKGAYVAELYDRELRRLRRYGGYMAVLDVTVYNYHTVRESHGAATADELLRGFAALLKRTLRTTDFLGYLGDGRFSLLLPSTDVTGVKALIVRIEKAVSEANERAPNRPEIKVSFHLRAAGGYDDLTKTRSG